MTTASTGATVTAFLDALASAFAGEIVTATWAGVAPAFFGRVLDGFVTVNSGGDVTSTASSEPAAAPCSATS
jgi:hypothetical protein